MEGAMADLSPEEWQKKYGHFPKNIYLALSPEEQKQRILQYKRLPDVRRKLVRQAVHNACSYCEKEFNVGRTGISHGACERHKAELYKKMGSNPPPSKGNKVVDLKELSPEEIELCTKLTQILVNKSREKISVRDKNPELVKT